MFHSVSTHNARLDLLDNNWVTTVNAILGRVGGIFKRSGNGLCLLCNTETATEFEIPLVQHKATTDQSPAITGPRANFGQYQLRHLLITGQVAPSGLLVKQYCRHLTSLACISICSVDPDLHANSYFVFGQNCISHWQKRKELSPTTSSPVMRT